MKALLHIALTSFVLLCASVLSAQETLKGIWTITEQENTQVEIKERNGVFEGRTVASDNKNAPIGKLILKEVKSAGGKYTGKLYAPKRAQWFDATLEPKGDKILVTVKAGTRSKTVEWIKE